MDWLLNPDVWLSLLTLTALEIVLGIDNLVVRDQWTPAEHQPGRMAVNTAICLLAIGIVAFSTAYSRRRSWLPAAEALVSSTVLAVALLSAFGYFAGLPAAYGWGGAARQQGDADGEKNERAEDNVDPIGNRQFHDDLHCGTAGRRHRVVRANRTRRSNQRIRGG